MHLDCWIVLCASGPSCPLRKSWIQICSLSWGSPPKEVTDSLTPEEVAEVITEMDSDEAVQVLEDMDEGERAEVLSSVPKEERGY